jgi:ABC-type branched-subunit amino acid transport system substrate-binding protein
MPRITHIRVGGAARLIGAAATIGAFSALLGGAFGGSASAASATKASKGPFNAMIVCPFSGAAAVAGLAEYDGMQAAAKVLNAHGGVLGHKVVVTQQDDAGSPVTAVSKVTAAMSSGTKYSMALGGCFGQDALAVAPLFAKTTIPDFAPLEDSQVAPPQHPNWFIGGTLTSTPEKAVAAAMKAKGITKFAIITGNDTTAVLGANELKAAAASLGMTVSDFEEVPDTSVDATSQMQAALASNPQALAVNNYTPVIGPILAARAKLDPGIPLYGDAYFGAANIGALTPSLSRIFVVTFPFLAVGNAAEKTASWKTFIAADRIYDPTPKISVYADITGYDAVMTAAAGATKAGTIAGKTVATAIGSLTSTSDVPYFVGSWNLFKPKYHAWGITPTGYETIRAGHWSNGLIVPGS